ncbi:hypothetical protein B0H19DRAFT_684343 [Mycena capillaripes]|nr:hypothetical protein B0H19DRAFT_684343 [Mycena capillaripes]
MDKGKGKVRSVDDAGRYRWDRYARRSGHSPPAPRAPTPSFPPAALAAAVGVLRGPIVERQLSAFASLTSPYPGAGGPRPSWFSVAAGADVDVLAHGDAPDLQARTRDEEGGMESTSAAADASASTSDARTPPPAALDPSPRIRFVEPVAVVPPEDAEVDLPPDVQSPYHDNPHNDALLDVGAGEPYRPSPESPIPVPQSDEDVQVAPEIALRTFGEQDASSGPAEPEAVPSERGASPIAMPPPFPAPRRLLLLQRLSPWRTSRRRRAQLRRYTRRSSKWYSKNGRRGDRRSEALQKSPTRPARDRSVDATPASPAGSRINANPETIRRWDGGEGGVLRSTLADHHRGRSTLYLRPHPPCSLAPRDIARLPPIPPLPLSPTPSVYTSVNVRFNPFMDDFLIVH